MHKYEYKYYGIDVVLCTVPLSYIRIPKYTITRLRV